VAEGNPGGFRALLSGGGFARLSLAEAREVQERLAGEVVDVDDGSPMVRLAGADVAYDLTGRRAHAALVVWDLRSRRSVETAAASLPVDFPYLPGYLAWRELPALAAAWAKLEARPDVVLCDAHGRAHPRRCGLACLLGLALDVAAIGCAKSLLVGRFGELGRERGAHAPLVVGGEVVGEALRTRRGVRPVFVSVGHRVSLTTACEVVLAASRTRIPEPLRLAHQAVTRLR
jgi:deoxyribonuclease V